MGKDLAFRFPKARRRFEHASEILGFDLAAVCFDGPEDALRQTRATQPALYVHSFVAMELLADRGVYAIAAAGHSVGEYAALACAGVFSFEDGLKLVKARAEAMQQAGEINPGTMAAIVGLDDAVVRGVCDEADREGIVVPANYNSPGQLVISGAAPAVVMAMELAKARGARIAKQLSVSGAFHSPLMKPAAEILSAALAAASLKNPKIPVVSNVTARAHENAESVRRLLAEQLLAPVRWTESVHELARTSNARWFEVGSGTVLSGLLKRTIPGASAKTVSSVSDLDAVVGELSVAP
jgi:[acyl-carrier-protein] S-malonyltransferase